MRRFLARPSSKPPNTRLMRPIPGNPLIVASPLNGSTLSALAVTALLISACGGGGSASTSGPAKKTSATTSKPKPAATKAPTDADQLNALLQRRAAALGGDDAAA